MCSAYPIRYIGVSNWIKKGTNSESIFFSSPWQTGQHEKANSSYQPHWFSSEIISRAVYPYHRFCFSFTEVEELLAERGVAVTYEPVRQLRQKFWPDYARKLKKRQMRLGDTWHIDEVIVTIQGQRQFLWRGSIKRRCHRYSRATPSQSPSG